MAITLVTGLPGHGKTLYSLFRFKSEAEKAGRPVFHNGINGLNIPGWQVWDSKNWQNLPAGALYILDEAWRDFPVRGRGEPPPHVGELAVHRHLGVDIVLITQDPMQIDSFVRRLVDRHFHIVRKFGTHFATIHEYANGARDAVAKGRGDSIKTEWRYPKDVFTWYTSSEKHTVKRRIPMRVWVLISMPFIIGGLGFATYWQLRPSYVVEQTMGRIGSASQGGVATLGGSPTGQAPRGDGLRGMSPVEYAQAFTPRVQGLPHTAPVYDDVTRPTEAPYPAACLNMPSKHRCSCYTQQATRLEIPTQICEQIAAGGFFLAWKQQVVSAVPVQPAASAPVPQLAGGFGGQSAPVVVAAGPEVVDDGPPRPHVRR